MYLSQSQRTIELYTELTTMICDFIGVSRIAQSTEFDYNNTKLNEFYADIISKMHMNKDILVKILELTGNGRLKHIKLESQSLPDDMLNMYGHQIITMLSG